jgi:hypothetical protein
LILALLVSNTAAAARDNPGDFFFAPLGEALMYSREGVSIGGGFSAGFGEGAALGIRLLYAQDAEQLAVLEAVFFLRFYLPRLEGAAGPFAQLNIGTALFGREKPPSFPAEAGIVSAGLALGWRFPLGSRWYIEPALRAGYPYIAGGGLSAGFRF